jgi:predicted transcriptional regulator
MRFCLIGLCFGLKNMSQDNILSFLRKNRRKWYSVKDLSPLLNVSDSSLSHSLSRLVKYSSMYNVRVKKGKRNKQFIRFD